MGSWVKNSESIEPFLIWRNRGTRVNNMMPEKGGTALSAGRERNIVRHRMPQFKVS